MGDSIIATYQLEQNGKRLPVYRYLRDLWRDHTDEAELTWLVMQQHLGNKHFL